MNLVAIFICAYFASVLASLAGVGGGGILIPLYVIAGKIEIKEAILLSIITIVGSSFVRTLYYGFKRHRCANNRFMPDYNVIRLVVPIDGNTAYIGFLLNKILPGYVLTIIIILLLCILIYKTIRKAIDYLHNKSGKDHIFIMIDNIEIEMEEMSLSMPDDRPGENWEDLFNYIVYILLAFTLITFFTIMRKLSEYIWTIYAFQFIIVSLFGYMTIKHISSIYETRRLHHFNFIKGDIVWNRKSFIKYSLAASFTGMISTLLGIGGGMIMNPIMINLNMLPEVVLATSSITNFFSAFISSFQFIIVEKKFEWYYGVLIAIGAIGALTSLMILKLLRKRIRFAITVTLVLTLFISMIMLVIINIMEYKFSEEKFL